MRNFIYLAALILAQVYGAFSELCYIASNNVAGTEKGTAYTDLDTLKANIESLTEVHRSAAIKSCQSTSNNDLVGIQVALTRYTANMADMPVDSELFWLPGLGQVTESSAVTCTTTVIERTAGLEKWVISSDETGIYAHTYYISNGVTRYFGNPSNSIVKKSQTFYFSPKYPMVGLYGWVYGQNLQGLGTLEYNSDVCPRESDQIAESGANGSGSSSGNWWETDSSSESTNWWDNIWNIFTSDTDGVPNKQELLIIGGIVLLFCFPLIVPLVTSTLGFMILSPFAAIVACKYVAEALIAKWCPQKKKVKQSKRRHESPIIKIQDVDTQEDENTASKLRSRQVTHDDIESHGTVPGRDTWYGAPEAPPSIEKKIQQAKLQFQALQAGPTGIRAPYNDDMFIDESPSQNSRRQRASSSQAIERPPLPPTYYSQQQKR